MICMGIILKQDENRSELQKRVAQQLTEKAKKKDPNPADLPDGVDDSAYMKNTKQTSGLAMLWIVIVVIGVGALIWYIIASGNQS